MSRLQVLCQVCWQPIERGHLGIDTQKVAAFQAAEAARGKVETADDLLETLKAGPEVPQWMTHCGRCEPNTCGYCIEVSQLRTYKDLVRWTAHLMGKTWFAVTDWDHMLDGIARGQDRRFREVAP